MAAQTTWEGDGDANAGRATLLQELVFVKSME